jgi:hypothetical protein
MLSLDLKSVAHFLYEVFLFQSFGSVFDSTAHQARPGLVFATLVRAPVVCAMDLASWMWLLPAACARIFPVASPPLKATILDFSVQSPAQSVLVIWILPLLISSVPAPVSSLEPDSAFCWAVLNKGVHRRPGQIRMSPCVSFW